MRKSRTLTSRSQTFGKFAHFLFTAEVRVKSVRTQPRGLNSPTIINILSCASKKKNGWGITIGPNEVVSFQKKLDKPREARLEAVCITARTTDFF